MSYHLPDDAVCLICGPGVEDDSYILICQNCKPMAAEQLRVLRAMMKYQDIDPTDNDDPRVAAWKTLEYFDSAGRL